MTFIFDEQEQLAQDRQELENEGVDENYNGEWDGKEEFDYRGNWGTTSATIKPKNATQVLQPVDPTTGIPTIFQIQTGEVLAQVETDLFPASRNLNVTLQLLGKPPAAAYDIFGVIEFGNDGFNTFGQIDIGRGVTIGVPGSYIRVMGVALFDPLVGGADIGDVKLGAFISNDDKFHLGSTQRSFTNSVTQPFIGTMSIPKFATSFVTYPDNFLSRVIVQQANSAFVITATQVLEPGAQRTPIQLLTDTAFLIVSHGLGPATILISTVFNIDL